MQATETIAIKAVKIANQASRAAVLGKGTVAQLADAYSSDTRSILFIEWTPYTSMFDGSNWCITLRLEQDGLLRQIQADPAARAELRQIGIEAIAQATVESLGTILNEAISG